MNKVKKRGVAYIWLFFILIIVFGWFSSSKAGSASNKDTAFQKTVLAPFIDGIKLDLPRDLAKNDLAKIGGLDVTKTPFFADPTGISDSTVAIQNAINCARDNQLFCFFPQGKYKISDTLKCYQKNYKKSNGKIVSGRQFPCMLFGSTQGKRPELFLAPGSTGFNDMEKPKYVVHFEAQGRKKSRKFQPNISFNQMFINIDITVGKDNEGAIAIRHRAAQGSGIQSSTIDVTNGYVGIEGAAGSGGSFGDIKIIGGKIGLDLRETQPAPTIFGVTLINQAQVAILYRGRQSLCAVGIKIISNTNGPVIQGLFSKNPHEGQICLIDSEIVFEKSGEIGVSAARSLYLNNVFFEKVNFAVSNPDGSNVKGNLDGWLHIDEYAHGVKAPAFKGYSYEAPVYINNQKISEEHLLIDEEKSPPDDLQSRHLWSVSFPSWESRQAVNVKAVPYGARGDGFTDDTKAIQKAINENEIVFLPKGYYRVTDTIKLNTETKLVGVAKHLSIIMATHKMTQISTENGMLSIHEKAGSSGSKEWGSDSDFDINIRPVIKTENSMVANTKIAFCGIYVSPALPNIYALNWESGGNSVLREVNFMTLPYFNVKVEERDIPLVKISGEGGGKWYNFFQEDSGIHGTDYRHLLVKNTLGPLRIYQCNPEHANSESNMEIRNSENVIIYGMKSETNNTSASVLKVVESDHIRLFGYGGNAQANKNKALFYIIKTPNIIFANLVDHPRFDNSNPDEWYFIEDYSITNGLFKTPPLSRPVLYRKANWTPLGVQVVEKEN